MSALAPHLLYRGSNIYLISMYYVYVLKSDRTGELYYGFTSNLKRRLLEHNSKSSFATKSACPWRLVYYEAYQSSQDAKRRENQLKRYGQALRRLKERIILSLSIK